jgi:hypothetical protein
MPPSAFAARRSAPRFNKNKEKKEPKILFQQFFKSVGPRTYAAQVKEAGNGNHFLVLTEGKRDEKTGDLRKSCVYVYSEDFVAFFQLVKEMSLFIKANPLPPEVKARRDRFWSKQGKGGPQSSDQPKPGVAAPPPAVPSAPAPSIRSA